MQYISIQAARHSLQPKIYKDKMQWTVLHEPLACGHGQKQPQCPLGIVTDVNGNDATMAFKLPTLIIAFRRFLVLAVKQANREAEAAKSDPGNQQRTSGRQGEQIRLTVTGRRERERGNR